MKGTTLQEKHSQSHRNGCFDGNMQNDPPVPKQSNTLQAVSYTHLVMVDGKPQFLNGATLREFLRNPDAQVRKDAYTNYFSEYKRLSAPMSNLLIGHAKGQVFNAHTRHFNTALEASLFEDDADKKLFDKVCMMANEKYISGFHAYNACLLYTSRCV